MLKFVSAKDSRVLVFVVHLSETFPPRGYLYVTSPLLSVFLIFSPRMFWARPLVHRFDVFQDPSDAANLLSSPIILLLPAVIRRKCAWTERANFPGRSC
jgi:hypothetical protein